MRIFLSSLLVLFSLNCFAECTFRPSMKRVVSLSGTTTVLLSELGLLQHPKLSGISIFNPVQGFKGKIYPGGIFLSQNVFKEFSDATILYDESRDLRRLLSSQKIAAREVRTRGLTPSKAIEEGLEILSDLTTACDEKMQFLRGRVKALEAEILSLLPKNPFIVFYLGDLSGARPPELLMVNDGVVKWLSEQKKIRTYPSELSYVNWSSKIMNSLPKEALHIGIKDSGSTLKKELTKTKLGITLVYPGSLVPGFTQLQAIHYLLKNL